MNYKQNIVGVTVTAEERQMLDAIAAAKGKKSSTLAKEYLTKGLEADTPLFTSIEAMHQHLVKEGLVPNIAAARAATALFKQMVLKQ